MINEPRTEWRQFRKWEPKCTLHAIKRKQLRIILAMWYNNVHRNVDFEYKKHICIFRCEFFFLFILRLIYFFNHWKIQIDWLMKNKYYTINIEYTHWVTHFALEKNDAKEPKVERMSKKGRCQQQSAFGFKKMTSNYIHIRNRCGKRISN